MKPDDSNQYNRPENAPKGTSSSAKLPGEESENIIKGAKQEDQLEGLQPKMEDEKAANKIGSPPVKEPGKDEPEATPDQGQ